MKECVREIVLISHVSVLGALMDLSVIKVNSAFFKQQKFVIVKIQKYRNL